MTQRYFVEPPITGERATLVAAEAHHLAHVMRGRAGDEITVFDGSGCEFTARVERVDRAAVQLAVLSRHEIDRELPRPLVVGASLPKGDRQRWLVEKLVELGATRFVPLETTRSVAQPTAGALDRLRRAVIEASKQCGRNRLMTIDVPQSWAQFVAQADSAAMRVVAHPGFALTLEEFVRRRYPELEAADVGGDAAGIVVAVGPEGGFADDEVAQAATAGWSVVNLGPRILRVETAATMLAVATALLMTRPSA